MASDTNIDLDGRGEAVRIKEIQTSVQNEAQPVALLHGRVRGVSLNPGDEEKFEEGEWVRLVDDRIEKLDERTRAQLP